jgi:hypothetical protein
MPTLRRHRLQVLTAEADNLPNELSAKVRQLLDGV